MARADGRVEPGQSLKSAFSARAWNRAQDAADIVLNERTVFGAEPSESMTLPSVRVKLGTKGWFGQCRFAIASGGGTGLATQGFPTNASIGDFSDAEKSLLRMTLPYTSMSGGDDPQLWAGLFVCVGNDSHEYAMAGFAITRIRVFNYEHRYARSPVPFYGQTNAQSSEVQGSLDSAFWGPAKIVGYCGGDLGGFSANIRLFHGGPALVYPNYEFRWALIQF
jgi:hypothetical protein